MREFSSLQLSDRCLSLSARGLPHWGHPHSLPFSIPAMRRSLWQTRLTLWISCREAWSLLRDHLIRSNPLRYSLLKSLDLGPDYICKIASQQFVFDGITDRRCVYTRRWGNGSHLRILRLLLPGGSHGCKPHWLAKSDVLGAHLPFAGLKS